MSIPTAQEYLEWKQERQRAVTVAKSSFIIRLVALVLSLVGMYFDEVPVMLFSIVLMLFAGGIGARPRR